MTQDWKRRWGERERGGEGEGEWGDRERERGEEGREDKDD